MYHLVVAKGKNCELNEKIKSGTYEELSSYTTKFNTSDDIRLKNKKVVSKFMNDNKCNGDIVIMDDTKNNSRVRVLYKSHVRIVKKLLKKIDVISVVVFVKNNAPYMGDENVINLKDLLLFIDSYPYKKILEKNEISEICRIIRENKVKVTKSEHLENISYLKQIKKENMAEIEYAIENQKCPRCGSNILQNGYSFKCPNCDFKFKI